MAPPAGPHAAIGDCRWRRGCVRAVWQATRPFSSPLGRR